MKYAVKNHDEEAQIRIEGIKVFCPPLRRGSKSDMERSQRIPPRFMALPLPSDRVQRMERMVYKRPRTFQREATTI